jgi:hypothetical protein
MNQVDKKSRSAPGPGERDEIWQKIVRVYINIVGSLVMFVIPQRFGFRKIPLECTCDSQLTGKGAWYDEKRGRGMRR